MSSAGAWSSGLLDCCDDAGLCCLTCFCPCVTFGRVAEIVSGGERSCGAAGAIYVLIAALTRCQWIYSCTYRARLRTQYALPDAPCCDCCVHLCCSPCALTQEYRELKARGFDPEAGWEANADKGNAPGAQQMGR
ncbi:hypothetical protein QYE76_029348 [Lolium multiflorum]|uniref:Uncharacterized protein n=1 Tax=Lolium multiflorum TaxID=4521 RepID=A0AAD8VI43_LOLMU|nr:hypothetical protein QYE76_029348 [Lolium multiflorum]